MLFLIKKIQYATSSEKRIVAQCLSDLGLGFDLIVMSPLA